MKKGLLLSMIAMSLIAGGEKENTGGNQDGGKLAEDTQEANADAAEATNTESEVADNGGQGASGAPVTGEGKED